MRNYIDLFPHTLLPKICSYSLGPVTSTPLVRIATSYGLSFIKQEQ